MGRGGWVREFSDKRWMRRGSMCGRVYVVAAFQAWRMAGSIGRVVSAILS